MNRFKKLLTGKEGASMVEYGLLVALIAVACTAAIVSFGGSMSSAFDYFAQTIKSVMK